MRHSLAMFDLSLASITALVGFLFALSYANSYNYSNVTTVCGKDGYDEKVLWERPYPNSRLYKGTRIQLLEMAIGRHQQR